MAVKVKKLRGSYYVVINHNNQRKTKKVGGTLEFARDVARKIEAKLTLNDLSIFAEEKTAAPVFNDLAKRWLADYIGMHNKPATVRVYGVMMNTHLLPYFGLLRLDSITGTTVKEFITAMVREQKNGTAAYTQSTVDLAASALRSFFNFCMEEKQMESNPAKDLGRRIAKAQKAPLHDGEVVSMTTKERDRFLAAVESTNPAMYPFFFCAVRTGLRRGELIGLKWKDVSFGQSAADSDRYLMVSRSFGADSGFGTPKSGKTRRVDMSPELRRVLIALRDGALWAASKTDKDSISDDLIFPEPGTDKPLKPNLVEERYMEPALTHAGLRRFTPHHLRHTFAVLLLQAGAPLKYVSEQLGHSSIAITADIYGRFQPGANIHWLDRVDSTQTNANAPQTQHNSDTTKERQPNVN